MPVCPECQSFVTHQQALENQCPTCQAAASEGAPWSDIARVPNLAEAGYLVSVLEHHEIEARLVHSDSFSATAGIWSTVFVLQVPSQSRTTAQELVRSEADALSNEQPEYDDFGEPIRHESLPLVIWRPVALMALAGLATLWLGQRMAEQRARQAHQRSTEALAEALAGIGRPMVVTSPTGRVSHQLSYQADSRTWLLETDTDNDGRLDRHEVFEMTADQ